MKLPHLFAFALLLLFVSPAMAQQCPIVSIEGPDTTEEKLVVLKARLSLDPRTPPQYRWSISRGSIVAGDSTSQITLDTTGVEGTSIDVTVEAIGVVTSCSTIAQLTLRVIREQMICGLTFDQYGDMLQLTKPRPKRVRF